MQERSTYILPLEGLKTGQHTFSFNVKADFFKLFGNSIISDGAVKLELEMDKRENLFVLDFNFDGYISTECDRCLEQLKVMVKDSRKLIVKYGEKSDVVEEAVIYISKEDQRLNISDLIYEFIYLGLPNKIVHDSEKDCNQEVIKALDKHKKSKNTSIDPRWEALITNK